MMTTTTMPPPESRTTSAFCEVCASASSTPLFDKAEHHFTRCDGCGLERISPQPDDATLARIYGEHYYDAWGLGDESATSVAALKKRTFRYVLDKLPPELAGGRLLDCGAATGFLVEVAMGLGYRPYAVELSEFGATAIAGKIGSDHVHCGELEQARFADVEAGGFDVVTMCDYIEHVRDPRRTLGVARALLRAGGALAITTPDAGSASRKLLRTGWTHYKLEHLFYFNRHNLQRLLRDSGFSSVTFHPLWKSLTLDYIAHQFEVYQHPALTPIARTVRRLTPGFLRTAPIPFSTGELLAIARV